MPTIETSRIPRHVALIMDGNGRWATARGLPRSAGHRAGAEAVEPIVRAAPELGISILTLYAFSADNWKRPADEVATLMRLLNRFLRDQLQRCLENDVRLSVIGRRDRLSPALVARIENAEKQTINGARLHLRIAIDYSARQAILRAAELAKGATLDDDAFARLIGAANNQPDPAPPVDLVVRTGGEQRLSDFLLWECAYAELLFTDVMWPDFTPEQLAAAVDAFRRRERRFGQVPSPIRP